MFRAAKCFQRDSERTRQKSKNTRPTENNVDRIHEEKSPRSYKIFGRPLENFAKLQIISGYIKFLYSIFKIMEELINIYRNAETSRQRKTWQCLARITKIWRYSSDFAEVRPKEHNITEKKKTVLWHFYYYWMQPKFTFSLCCKTNVPARHILLCSFQLQRNFCYSWELITLVISWTKYPTLGHKDLSTHWWLRTLHDGVDQHSFSIYFGFECFVVNLKIRNAL